MSRHRAIRNKKYTTGDLSDEDYDYDDSYGSVSPSPGSQQFLYHARGTYLGEPQEEDLGDGELVARCIKGVLDQLADPNAHSREYLQEQARKANYSVVDCLALLGSPLKNDDDLFPLDTSPTKEAPPKTTQTQKQQVGPASRLHPSTLAQNLNSRNQTSQNRPPIFHGETLNTLTKHAGETDIQRFDFQTSSPDDLILQQQAKAFHKKKEESPLAPRPAAAAPVKFQGKSRLQEQQQREDKSKIRSTPAAFQSPAKPTNGTKSSPGTPAPPKAVPGGIKFTANSPIHSPRTASAHSDSQLSSDADDDFMRSTVGLQNKKVKQNTESKRKDVLAKINADLANQANKPHLSLVVIGHVDAGKSTIMGHLLYLTGNVTEKTMNRYTKDSQQMGKGSFSFAWVLDEHAEERQRGVTIDVAVSSLETKTKRITLLDAPGHRDFIPNMISGAAMADVAVLVVDSSGREFERGFEEDGQTREHIQLAKSLGVSYLIIAVNKLDLNDWSTERYNYIIEQMKPFLKRSGFISSAYSFLPCSGLLGENLTKQTNEQLKKWYTGPTLLDAIDQLAPPDRIVDQNLRMVVSDVYKDSQSGLGIAVGGRIEGGYLAKTDQVLVMPINELCTIKSIKFQGENVDFAYCGRNVDIGLTGIQLNMLSVGSVLCDPMDPIPLVQQFEAQIVAFNSQRPILRGTSMSLHLQSLNEPAYIKQILCLVDPRSGEVKNKKPKCVASGDVAHVIVRLDRPICLELYSTYKSLGRFSLRDCGRTLAAGIVTKIPSIDL